MPDKLPPDEHRHASDPYLQAHQRGLVRDALAADAVADGAGDDLWHRVLDNARLRHEMSFGPNPFEGPRR